MSSNGKISSNGKSAVSLLVIDDNQGSVELLSNALAQPGLRFLRRPTLKRDWTLFRNRRPQIVLTDLMMPHMSGMEVLERIVEIDPATDVILMTAHYSTESAVEAVKKGASDYLNKPVSIGPLRERIGTLVEEVRKRQRALQLEDELRTNSEFEGIVGRSPQMWEMFWRIRRVAPHYRARADHGRDRDR
jgi:DNA-binding NtrC family response regulator